MNTRKNSGGVTSFSIACLILIAIIGTMAFQFTELMGGDGQLQRACDAGTVNLARTALITPQVLLNDSALPVFAPDGNSYPYEDFFACVGETSPTTNTIGTDLSNYNKVAAQALIVADNAQVEGTPTALANAKLVVDAAHQLGYAVRTRLENNAGLEAAFTSMAQSNILNMLGDTSSAMTFNSMAVSWLNQGDSNSLASTYVDSSTVSNTFYASLPLNTTSPIQPTPNYTPATPLHFLTGYQAIPLLNGTDSIAFLVDRPCQTPNLVSLTAFQAGQTPLTGNNNDLAYLMPNAFQATCKATDKSISANPTLSTLACSVIGSVNNGTVASIPAGYIRVVNGYGQTLPAPDSNSYDASSKDLFDDISAWPYAVWVSPPITTTQGTFPLFSSNLVSLAEWYAWAQSVGHDRGHDGNLDPLVPYGSSASAIGLNDVPSPRIRKAINSCGAATLADLMALSNTTPSNWQFSASNWSLNSVSKIVHFLKFDEDGELSLPHEWNKLVTNDGGGNFTINGGSIFPIFDQACDGSEPTYIMPFTPIIAGYYNRRNVQSASCSAFLDGIDVVSWLKLQVLKDRANYQYEDTVVIPNMTYTINGIHYCRGGKLYIAKRWGISPYTTDSVKKYAYLQHHSVYSTSGADQTIKYATAASPWQYIQEISAERNGPVPFDPKTGNTDNGIVNLGLSGDHTVDLSDEPTQSLLQAILQRCQQIQPGCTLSQITAALDTDKLAPGQTGYLYVDPTSHNFTFSTSLSYADPSLVADNPNYVIQTTGFITCCAYGGQTDKDLQYNSLINTTVDNVYSRRSDANFHKAAWKFTKGTLQYQDAAIFHPCSGYHNMVGELDFETDLRNVAFDGSGNYSDNGSSIFMCWPN